MITEKNKLKELFLELNNEVRRKLSVYVLGGASLLARGIKDATKDIDIVVAKKAEFFELQRALDNLNFAPALPTKEYRNMELSQIFQKQEFRVDLFKSLVCRKFCLSQEMIKRAEKLFEFNHLSVFLCSNEDIFLFKTMTEREGDIADCISIAATQNIDWNIILEELKSQIKKSKQDVWITWVGERLDILADRGIDIPIMKDVDLLRENFLSYIENKYGSK